MFEKLTQNGLLVLACCFALILLPLSSAWAQEDTLKKAGEGIQKGAETVVDKTKEGAEAVGEGAKDLVTDDDPDTDKDEIPADRQKPTEVQSDTQSTTTPSSEAAKGTSTSTEETEASEDRELPATAGELPLLGLIGALALAGAGALRIRKYTEN